MLPCEWPELYVIKDMFCSKKPDLKYQLVPCLGKPYNLRLDAGTQQSLNIKSMLIQSI